MMQSKRMSLIEALTNIGVGMLISFLAQLWLFPRYGIHVSTSDNVEIVLFFTAISVVRSYSIRRIFNRIRFGRDKSLKTLLLFDKEM